MLSFFNHNLKKLFGQAFVPGLRLALLYFAWRKISRRLEELESSVRVSEEKRVEAIEKLQTALRRSTEERELLAQRYQTQLAAVIKEVNQKEEALNKEVDSKSEHFHLLVDEGRKELQDLFANAQTEMNTTLNKMNVTVTKNCKTCAEVKRHSEKIKRQLSTLKNYVSTTRAGSVHSSTSGSSEHSSRSDCSMKRLSGEVSDSSHCSRRSRQSIRRAKQRGSLYI